MDLDNLPTLEQIRSQRLLTPLQVREMEGWYRCRRLLARPNPCVMATLRKDGSPVTVPTWYRLVADRIHLNLDAGQVRVLGDLGDPALDAHVRVPVVRVQHGQCHPRVASEVLQPHSAGVEVEVDPVTLHESIPGRHGNRGAVLAQRRHDGRVGCEQDGAGVVVQVGIGHGGDPSIGVAVRSQCALPDRDGARTNR